MSDSKPTDNRVIASASPVETLRAGGFGECQWLQHVESFDHRTGRHSYRPLAPFTDLDERAFAYLRGRGYSVEIGREGALGQPLIIITPRPKG